MLPRPGVYYFPWEVSAGHVPDGGTLRTFGRLSLYDTVHSRATLTVQHGSEQHQVLVCTKLVEPFQAQVGALYVVLGELDQQKGDTPLLGHSRANRSCQRTGSLIFQAGLSSKTVGPAQSTDGTSVVKARVLTCVEGMNLPLLEQAIQEQRRYQQGRDGGS
ncbi:CST complex subunit TEN1 [Tupaia chinensis]|uniref:CST complex subunit TEN1 n=1 Tax=Tupaia chinensis TaxID=246437 RepID=L9KZA5_TUPCH|nr:CST complex subunit TEN1 [Tupaia chinensis]